MVQGCTTAPESGVIGGRGVFGVMVNFDVMGKGADVAAFFPTSPAERLKGT